jgi:hypothetical protein
MSEGSTPPGKGAPGTSAGVETDNLLAAFGPPSQLNYAEARTEGRSSDTSVLPPVDAETDQATTRSSPTRQSAQRFAWAYLAAFLVGAIPVFASAETFWPVPLIAMGVYLAVGTRRAHEGGVIFEFADSFYYLGFTLSVSSLLASLEPFNFVRRPDPEKVFHYFGLGMLTTLAGVVGRTMLQTYYRMPAETIESVNRRIEEQAHDYLEGIAELNTQVSRTIIETAHTYSDLVMPELDKIAAALSRTTAQLESGASTTSTLTANAQAMVSGLTSLEARYSSAAAAIGNQQNKLDAATALFSQALERAALVASKAGEQAGSELAVVLTTVEACANALSGLASKIGALNLDVTPFNIAVTEFGKTISDAARSADREFAKLQAAVGGYDDLAASLSRSTSQLQTATIKESLAAFEGELTELVNATRLQREATADEIESLRQQSATLLDATKSMSKVLDEITEAILRKLDRLP